MDDCDGQVLQQRQRQRHQPSPPLDTQATSSPSLTIEKVCSALFGGKDNMHKTALELWNHHMVQIHKASIPASDEHQIHSEWMWNLLQLLKSQRLLQRGLLREAPYESWRAILQIWQARLEDSTTQSQAQPLRILVMGGSTTEGQGCHLVSKHLNVKNATKGTTGRMQSCAWPHRLQQLLNHFTNLHGPQQRERERSMVEIINLSIGGTNSGLAGPFLKYWLNPSAFAPHGPDIVINAYSTNDAVPPAYHYGAAPYNTTMDFHHIHKIMERRNDFIQNARNSYCGPHQGILPLIIFLDDYVGDQQQAILADMQLADITQDPPSTPPSLLSPLSSSSSSSSSSTTATIDSNFHHDFSTTMHISYANVVRRLVYAFTRETIFTPSWNLKDWTKASIHFGMSAHVAITWVVAFGFLQMTVNTCQDDIGRKDNQYDDYDADNNRNEYPPSLLSSTLPSPPPPPPPPHSTNTLDLSLSSPDIGCGEMESSFVNVPARNITSASATIHMYHPCIFAFLAAPLGTHNNAYDLNSFLKPYTIYNKGWQAMDQLRDGGYQNKLGVVADQVNATWILEFQNIPQPIRVLTLHTLKSYTEKFRDCVLEVTLEVIQNTLSSNNQQLQQQQQQQQVEMIPISTFSIAGYHNQTTSIAEPFVLDLSMQSTRKTIQVGNTLRLRLQLVRGTAFQLNALMLCSK